MGNGMFWIAQQAKCLNHMFLMAAYVKIVPSWLSWNWCSIADGDAVPLLRRRFFSGEIHVEWCSFFDSLGFFASK